MQNTVINVEHLTKAFADVQAVKDVSFSVAKGSTCALLGGNGAGKTTTLSMLLGLLLPTSGSITILGMDMLQQRYDVLRRMNFTSPYVDLPLRLSVQENLMVYARLYSIHNARQRLDELAEELELNAFIKRPCGTLSAGQKTRVALAKSLLNEPEILLLDEPTASMDPDTADRMREYLHNYREHSGATLLLASHNMQEVERLCDQVFMLREGSLVDEGTPADLISRYGRTDLEQVFLDIARRQTAAEVAG
jgi:ABC-2 type transport system ATP-binding protein